ncbi:uncharacterized protein EV420DRAFT_833583, partial [Desarmillaria tabescens]
DAITLASVPSSPLFRYPYCSLHSIIFSFLGVFVRLFGGHHFVGFCIQRTTRTVMTAPFKDTAPGDVSPSVPQEVLDYILDFLHDDAPTLRTCSLVCHALLPCSRYHIYSNVFIVHKGELDEFREQYAGQLYHCENLATLLKNYPHVAPLVTRFGIHANSMMSEILMEISLVPIIKSLHNLSHVEFVARQYQGFWTDFPVARRKVFLAALRSVPLKTFISNGITYQGNKQFRDVFTAAANPALKHLSIVTDNGADWTSENYPPIRPPPKGLPALESLTMAGAATCSNIAWMFFSQSLYNISSVHHLSLQMYYENNASLVQRLLNAMQGSLEYFILDVNAWTDQQVRLDLSRLRSLSSFFMILASPLDSRLLRVRLSPTLRTLKIEQVCHNWEHSLDQSVHAWAQFDAHLDALPLPALQCVHIRLHDSSHGTCYCFACHAREHGVCKCFLCYKDKYPCTICHGREHPTEYVGWKRQVEDKMPLLKARGILEVELVKRRYCIQRTFD